MIEAFRRWLLEHRRSIKRDGVSLELSEGSQGLLKNGVSATFNSAHSEAMIELWETGESEFYFADWNTADRDPNYQPEVTHYDFQSEGEMFTALAAFVKRIHGTAELPQTPASLFISGHSETVYDDPIPGKQFLAATTKGKSE